MTDLSPLTLQWSRELARCERSFEYTASTYLRIKSKEQIGFPTLKLNRVQRKIHAAAEQQLREEGHIRLAIGKSRQVGSSTYWQARQFHQVAFRPYRNALLIAHDEPSAIEIFSISKGYYDALPDPLKPRASYDAKQRMVFPGRNSKLLATHAANTNVAAGQMLHLVHVTEAARFGPHADQVQASLFPTISEARGDDYSMVVVESTSVFGGDWFKQFWEASRAGETGYRALFIPWFEHEPYQATVPRDFELTHDERDLKRQFHLTDAQLQWRRLKVREYAGSPALFQQEYPHSWEASWVMPKGTLRVFTDEVLEAIGRDVRPPEYRAWPSSTGLQRSLGAPVEIWEAPKEGVFYDMGVDVSGGESERADWSVACIVRRDTLAQVAQARVHMNPASDDFISMIYWLGYAYTTAQICPDITGGWGNALLTELQARSYGNIWRWRRRDDAKQRVSHRIGFLYNKREKANLVSNAVALATRGECAVSSETLLDEMREFINFNIDEWAAATGCYDDCVNAWMLALLAARDERVIHPNLPEEPQVTPAWEETPWSVHDIDADLVGSPADRAAIVVRPWAG